MNPINQNFLIGMARYANIGGQENFLTEALAGALRADPLFAQRFLQTILEIKSVPRLESVSTQASYPPNYPDMELRLGNGDRILVENKIDASETVKEITDDDGIRKETAQLECYLDVATRENMKGVVFIRKSSKNLSPSITNHPKYLKPSKRDHFLWRDLFACFSEPAAVGSIEGNLRGFFEWKGFVPPNPMIGDLETSEAARMNLQKLWDSSYQLLKEQGWQGIGSNKLGELYSMQRSFASMFPPNGIDLHINVRGGDQLTIRFTPNPTDHVPGLENLFRRLPHVRDVKRVEVSRESSLATGLSGVAIVASLREVVGAASSSDTIAESLCDYVRRVTSTMFTAV